MYNSVCHQIFQIASRFSDHKGLTNPGDSTSQEIKISELGIDSLSKLEMVMEIEERLQCDLPEVGLSACESLKDLVALCERCLKMRQT